MSITITFPERYNDVMFRKGNGNINICRGLYCSMALFSVLIICFVMLAILFELISGVSRLETFEDITVIGGNRQPLVSIIVPACNEERSLEKGLRSLCSQDYGHLEIIVVNDRSTDKTAEIMHKVSLEYPIISVVEIEVLPPGWLGKPHALQKGAERAKGEYLLFTDADVCLEKQTISRAVTIMTARTLDHLALIFRNSTKGLLLNTLIADAGAGILLMFKPWKARDRSSRFFTGVGAFNMVRTSSYRKIGAHEKLKRQVIDDLFLGKLLKRHGFHQECMLSNRSVTVPWYGSVSEMISGLMKNVFALFHYRLDFAFWALVMISAGIIWPMAGIFFLDGPARLLSLIAVAIRVFGFGICMVSIGLPPLSMFLLLATPFISIYIIIKAVWTTSRAGGITWRDHFYPLDELKQEEWLLSGLLSPVNKAKRS